MSLIKCPECGHEVSDQAEACPNCGHPLIKNAKGTLVSSVHFLGGIIRWLAIISISIIVLVVIWTRVQSNNEARTLPGTANKNNINRSNSPEKTKMLFINKNISLDAEGSIGAPKSVLVMDFVITNNSERPIKDVTVECKVFGESGTFVDFNKKTIYQSFAPGERKLVFYFNMGFVNPQGVSTSCSVTNFEFN